MTYARLFAWTVETKLQSGLPRIGISNEDCGDSLLNDVADRVNNSFCEVLLGTPNHMRRVYLVYVDEPACDAMSGQGTLSLISARSTSTTT